MTKDDINYRLPVQCCAKCVYAYWNTYGDACCRHLAHTDIIQEGGVCDLYSLVEPVIEDEYDLPALDIAGINGSCVNCYYSYYSADDKPICGVSMEEIEDINASCNAWEIQNG